MTPQAKAHQLRDIASRLQKLGCDIPDPELLNGGDETLIAILAAIVGKLEGAQTRTGKTGDRHYGVSDVQLTEMAEQVRRLALESAQAETCAEPLSQRRAAQQATL